MDTELVKHRPLERDLELLVATIEHAGLMPRPSWDGVEEGGVGA